MMDQRKVREFAEDQGWTIVQGGKHMKWISPTGETFIQAVTASDHRAWRNHLARLRKAGLAIPRKNHTAKEVAERRREIMHAGRRPARVRLAEGSRRL